MALQYREIAARIEARIAAGNWRTGEQMPTLREFCAEFDAKQNTVQRALAHLAETGRVEARRGAGYFVAAPERPKVTGKRIAVYHHTIHPSRMPLVPYSSVALTGIQEMAERDGAVLEIRYGIAKERAAKDIAQLDPRVRAIILLGSSDMWRGIPADLSLPAVGVAVEDAPDGWSTVQLDPLQCARLAAAHFSARKVRRVRLYGAWALRGRNERARLFASLWPGEVEWRDHSDYYTEGKPIISRFPDDYPEDIGYWFNHGTMADFYARHFRQVHGQELAEARAVLAFDGKSLLNPHCYEPMDCVTPDWKQAGRLAYREAVRRIEEPGGGPARLLLPVRLAAQARDER